MRICKRLSLGSKIRTEPSGKARSCWRAVSHASENEERIEETLARSQPELDLFWDAGIAAFYSAHCQRSRILAQPPGVARFHSHYAGWQHGHRDWHDARGRVVCESRGQELAHLWPGTLDCIGHVHVRTCGDRRQGRYLRFLWSAGLRLCRRGDPRLYPAPQVTLATEQPASRRLALSRAAWPSLLP